MNVLVTNEILPMPLRSLARLRPSFRGEPTFGHAADDASRDGPSEEAFTINPAGDTTSLLLRLGFHERVVRTWLSREVEDGHILAVIPKVSR